jgi:hypothetical protein
VSHGLDSSPVSKVKSERRILLEPLTQPLSAGGLLVLELAGRILRNGFCKGLLRDPRGESAIIVAGSLFRLTVGPDPAPVALPRARRQRPVWTERSLPLPEVTG